MGAYDRDFFLRSYRAMETEELLNTIAGKDLAGPAAEAAHIVLTERGVSGDRLQIEYSEAIRRQLRSGGVTNQCDYCGASTFLGAVTDGEQRFCSERCRVEIRLLERSIGMPTDLIVERALRLRGEACPACGTEGGMLDVRTSEAPVSLLWVYSDGRRSALLCRRCGDRANLWGIAVRLLLGWWSFPGLFATPGTIYRNWKRFRAGDEGMLSEAFLHEARLRLASELPPVPAHDRFG